MKTASSGKRPLSFTPRLAIATIAGAIAIASLGIGSAPALRAETPPDQLKAAGAIALTTELMDKMDKFIKAVGADEAAKAELAVVGKDASITPETWGSVIAAKCPKALALFKDAALTADEFAKGIFAIMAVAMGEDMAKSEDKTVKANADFVTANKDRCDAVFSGFMMLGEPGAKP
jgi:hypothetical protein